MSKAPLAEPQDTCELADHYLVLGSDTLDECPDEVARRLLELRDWHKVRVTGLGADCGDEDHLSGYHGFIANSLGSSLVGSLPDKLVGYCLDELSGYVHSKSPEGSDFADLLSPSEKQCLVMLFLKGKEMAFNSVDLYVWALKSMGDMPSLQNLDENQKKILLRATLLHDIGKINLPNIVLENPIPHFLQEVFYKKYLENNAGAKERAIGFREGLPTSYLLNFSRGLLTETMEDKTNESGSKEAETHSVKLQRFRKVLCEYFKKVLGESEGKLRFKEMISILEEQLVDLNRAGKILRDFGIPDQESFKATLDRHEAISLVLLKGADDFQSLGKVVSRHHDNPVSQVMRATREIALGEDMPEDDKVLYFAIRIFDIVSALRQKRSYKKAMDDAEVAKILRSMYTQKEGFLDEALTEEFIETFLAPVVEEDREGRESET